MANLQTPLRAVVGETTAKALGEALKLRTVGDLLWHFPRRHVERGEHTDLSSLAVGEYVTVMAEIKAVNKRTMRQRRGSLLEIVVSDGRRSLSLTFFNQSWRDRELRVGRWGLFAGKVSVYRGKRQLNSPDYRLFPDSVPDPDSPQAAEELEEFAGALVPVYSITAAIKTWVVAKAVRVALDTLEPLPDPLPSGLRARRNLVDLHTALRNIHRPETREDLAKARRRLKWDEAFALQVTLVQRKVRSADWPAKPRPGRDDGLLAAFEKRLPFTLTDGQREVGDAVAADLAVAHPMHRLLQGEVGSGKTVVALRAMLQVVDSGGQAALLAPTEVLATQHYRSVADLLGPLGRAGELDGAADGTRVTLLTGSLGSAARRRVLAEIADGTAGIVVGTHALLYESVEFRDLGLVVVDEQHRFGVEQRDALRDKADFPPHVLVMTATPIPRTVAMTVYGDLEVSALTELPRGRSPITSFVVPTGEERWLARAWQRLREEVKGGHQAYVVCPRIGETAAPDDVGELVRSILDSDPDAEEPQRPPLSVLDIAPMLAEGPLHDLRIGVLHGRLPADEKDAVMSEFAAGRLDALVATTVVEVGVDVPNATMMVVMDADRFGVSQLHQLRGRVGRGVAPGLCLLVTDAAEGTPARERLEAVACTLDGFRLAELDLEQRREGDVLGAVQSGRQSHIKLLSLLRDADLIGEARIEAIELVEADPELTGHPLLADTVAALVTEERAEYLEKG